MDALPPLPVPGAGRGSPNPHHHHQQQQRISAPYGHACTNCAKAKCKCVFSRGGPGPGGSSVCDRCHRLSRECVPSQTVRKRGSARARSILRGSAAALGARDGDSDVVRTAQLEEKLDDLVSLLRSQASASVAGVSRGNDSVSSASASASGSASASNSAAEAGVNIGPKAIGVTCNTSGGGPHQVPTPDSSTSGDGPHLKLKDMYPFSQLAAPVAANGLAVSACLYQPPAEPAGTPTAISELTLTEADECLEIFRTKHLQYFPFVYIPSDVTYVAVPNHSHSPLSTMLHAQNQEAVRQFSVKAAT